MTVEGGKEKMFGFVPNSFVRRMSPFWQVAYAIEGFCGLIAESKLSQKGIVNNSVPPEGKRKSVPLSCEPAKKLFVSTS